jgi:hypothetical protein
LTTHSRRLTDHTQGLSEGDISTPLLLQLLSQHMAQQPLQQNSLPVYKLAQQAAAAAAPDYTHIADSASLQQEQQQQQRTSAYASAIAAKPRASKSGSYIDDVEEDLLTASMLHGAQSHEEEEYAAVFVSTKGLTSRNVRVEVMFQLGSFSNCHCQRFIRSRFV